VVKSKTAQRDSIELNLEIRMKDENTDFINILSEMNGVDSACWSATTAITWDKGGAYVNA